MMKNNNARQRRREAAFALLEYCAGAAVIAGVVWVALSAMGTQLGDLLTAIGEWAAAQAASIRGS